MPVPREFGKMQDNSTDIKHVFLVNREERPVLVINGQRHASYKQEHESQSQKPSWWWCDLVVLAAAAPTRRRGRIHRYEFRLALGACRPPTRLKYARYTSGGLSI